MRNYDLEFLKKFSLVIGFLMLVTVGLMAGAYYVHQQVPAEVHPAVAAQTHARIAPMGEVYAGATGAAQQAEAAKAALAEATKDVPFGGSTDGSVIYNGLCTGCHTSGAGGAPTLTAAGMGARKAKGVETLYKHAIEGFQGTGMMPAKGGNPALTDEQVKATVDWMLANVK